LAAERPAEQDTPFTLYDETDVDHGYQDSHKDHHKKCETRSEGKVREDGEAGSGPEEDTDAPQGDEGRSS
jgi:hypothetical protein